MIRVAVIAALLLLSGCNTIFCAAHIGPPKFSCQGTDW